MKTNFIRDSAKINEILDLIQSNMETEKNKIKISRVNSGYINFYYQLDNENLIYFMVFNPTEYYQSKNYK